MYLEIGQPNEKQRIFFTAEARYIAYGGARGGGKSWAVRVKSVLLALKYAGIKILIMRRSFPELRENHILPLRAATKGVAVYKDSEKCLNFANGSRVKFGYCAGEGDVLQYQGQEYDCIFIDEATQFTEFQFSAVSACLRGANSFPKRIYLTCNPGGVGHAWVKRLFIDRSYADFENPDDYCFIPAKVYDNEVLMKRDPDYLKSLKALPQELKKAWLDGDWNVFAGQYFSEWDYETHTIDDFEIPACWRRYAALDYGLDMLACYFIAVDSSGGAYVYDEIYQSGLVVSAAAELINARAGGTAFHAFYAPPDLWNRHSDTGKSTADIFFEHGVKLCRVSNDRVQGWLGLKELLRVYEDEQGQRSAGLKIFKSCRNLIRTLPQLQFDPVRKNDVAGEPHEFTHAPDAIRYFVAGRPAPHNRRAPPEKKPHFSALENNRTVGKEKINVI